MQPRTTIAEEIKQTRPFVNRGAEVLVAVLRTASVLRKRVEEVVESEGLSLPQYNVLRILRGARSPLPTMEIAERMIEEAPGITRIVNNLDERGLIRREQWAGDRRCTLCQISPAGLKLLERLDERAESLDLGVTGDLTPEEIDRLLEYLSAVRNTSPT